LFIAKDFGDQFYRFLKTKCIPIISFLYTLNNTADLRSGWDCVVCVHGRQLDTVCLSKMLGQTSRVSFFFYIETNIKLHIKIVQK
jgi:hypothetical protein